MRHVYYLILIFSTVMVTNVIAQQVPDNGPGGNPLQRHVYPPDLVIRFAEEINLSKNQSAEIRDAVKATEMTNIDLRWEMRDETQTLMQMTNTHHPDEEALLAQADKVMTLEKDVKLTQMRLLVKIKNILTPEQQDQLQQLRAQPGGDRQGGSGVGQARRLNNPRLNNPNIRN
jgi:Spy/CpxP family protein refolding chaperone